MKYFYLFRHGQTHWNVLGRLQGHLDIPLNEIGQIQAMTLSDILRPSQIEAIFTSDLARATSTAKIISQRLGISIQITKNLREVFLGQAQGLEIRTIDQNFGIGSWASWSNPDPQFDHMRFPQGESKIEAANRIAQALKNIARNFKFSRIGICTHGFILSSLFSKLFNEPKSFLDINNGDIFCFAFNVETQIWTYEHMDKIIL